MGERAYLSHAGHREDTRVAITGSSGQIGSVLYTRLAPAHRVSGFDLRPCRISRRLDVASLRAGRALRGFDVICHLAARISVEESVHHPPLVTRTNVLGTVRVLEAARHSDARVVFFSSAAAYGTPRRLPIDESHPLRPMSPYGLSKAVGEQYAELYRELYGLNVAIVRPFNVYSEAMSGKNPYAGVMHRFIESAVEKRPLQIQGDGGQTRDFVHVSDVVELVALLLDGRGDGQVFNCGTGTGTRIGDLANWVHDRFDPKGEILHVPGRSGDIRHSVADIDRARRIGFRPKVTLKRWLERLPTPRVPGAIGRAAR